MNLFESLISTLGNKSENKHPEGLCPNCWGQQEYSGKFYEAVKNHESVINNVNSDMGWIRDYVRKNLSSIQLERNEGDYICPNCKLKYKEE